MSNKTAEIQCPTCGKSSFTDPEKAKEWQGLEEQLKVAIGTLEEVLAHRVCEVGTTNEQDDEDEEDSIISTIKQALTKLKGGKQ